MTETPIFRFSAEHYFIKNAIILACRKLLARPDLTPWQASRASFFLWLALQLPRRRPEYTGSLTVKWEYPESWGAHSVKFIDGGFELESSEGFDSGSGWDHESTTEFTVSEDGIQVRNDLGQLEEWLSLFCQECEDPDVTVFLEWYPEDELPPLNELPDHETLDQLWAEDE